MGLALYFPKAVGPGSTVTYVSADLSDAGVEVAESELDEIDKADQEAAEASAEVESGESLP
jgi:hypothetical protein